MVEEIRELGPLNWSSVVQANGDHPLIAEAEQAAEAVEAEIAQAGSEEAGTEVAGTEEAEEVAA